MSVNTVPFADLIFAVLFLAAAATLWALVYALDRASRPARLPELPPDVYADFYAELDKVERGQWP